MCSTMWINIELSTLLVPQYNLPWKNNVEKAFNMLLTWTIRGAFNKFPDFFFLQEFKIVVDSWKFSILLLYILWDDWLIFMISASNE